MNSRIKILKIGNYLSSNYTMWYRFEKSIKQKIILVNGNRVKPTDKIFYICPCCKKEKYTIIRTFNNNLGKYLDKGYWYFCKDCMNKNHDFSNFKEKQEATKRKNKSKPKDIIEREGKLGFIGQDQSKGSDIRNKMEETKKKNNSNTNKGTEAYFKRQKTYSDKSKEELESIKEKQNITKTKNGTHPRQKTERGEVFGFVNIDPKKRKELDKKISLKLKSIQSNGKL